MKLQRTFLAIALSLSGMSVATAQSTSGSIIGDAVTGDTIEVHREETGFKRELKITRDGRYTVSRVPAGTYLVVKTRADGTIEPTQAVVVMPGGSGRAR